MTVNYEIQLKLEQLQARLGEVAGRRWDKTVARQHDFSEYVVYGVFAYLVLNDDESGHRAARYPQYHRARCGSGSRSC